MKIRVIKLGTECKDRATELAGTVTHWNCNMDQHVLYLFQPKGLDEEGQPIKKLGLETSRLDVTDKDFEEVEIPFQILGTTVKNVPSGFTGMAIDFVRHINGCFHVTIQPKGTLPKKGCPIRANQFDLRECCGEMITELSQEELARSKRTNPSPTDDIFEPIRVTNLFDTIGWR